MTGWALPLMYVNVININIEDEMELTQRLDDFGKPAWIGLMILGFIIFWPVGLAILGYLIWSGRMGCSSKGMQKNWGCGWGRSRRDEAGSGDGANSAMSRSMRAWSRHAPASGNRAFDEYRAETMRRLEDEFDEFQGFLDQLRQARDKKEFDKFMASRAKTVDGEAGTEESGKAAK